MLPAISSDLPAYLMPPKAAEEGRRTTPDEFGPPARVDISAETAIDVQSLQPGTGLYGPNGQFVDTAGRRELQNQTSSDSSRSQPDSPPQSSDTGGDTAPAQSQAAKSSPAPSRSTQTEDRNRAIALDNYDAIVPPAAREELRALADRVSRKSSEQKLSPDEYKKLAELMTRVGRHSDASWALGEAKKLEQSGEPKQQTEAPSILTTAGVA